MSIAKDVAQAIVKSNLWGDVNPNSVLMLCYLAEAEGHHPAVVYRDYHIMSGKPSKKAEAILRDFITGGGKIKWHTLDDTCADATFTHASGEARIEWTLERAKQAGVARNAMWQKYPRQMLRSRCISEGVRTVYPGATSGLYEEGEVADIVAEEAPQSEGVREQYQDGEVSPAPSKGWREPDSPLSTPSKLSKEMHRLERELFGCGDSDMVYGLTATDEWKEFVRIADKHAPHYLRGGEPAPPEFEGLLNTAERMVSEFDTEIANGKARLATA